MRPTDGLYAFCRAHGCAICCPVPCFVYCQSPVKPHSGDIGTALAADVHCQHQPHVTIAPDTIEDFCQDGRQDSEPEVQHLD